MLAVCWTNPPPIAKQIMDIYLKQLLKYLLVYILFWVVMTQINDFAALVSLYLPIFWVFVYFPAMQHSASTGVSITLLAGLFLESQFPEIRGFYLPLMMLVFLVLMYRRSKVVDSKNSTQIAIASLVHWILMIVPSGVLHLTGRHPHTDLLWQRTLQDGVTGQLMLFFLYPVLTIGFVLMGGRKVGEEHSISV